MLTHQQTNGKSFMSDQNYEHKQKMFNGSGSSSSFCSTESSSSSSFCGSSSPEDLNSKRYRTAFSREQLHRLENGNLVNLFKFNWLI